MTSLLSRSELLLLLDRAQQHRLTLLVSPSGYGKTTLLNEWQTNRDELLIIRFSVPDENFSMNRALKHILIDVRKKIHVIEAPLINVFTTDVQLDTQRLITTLIQVFESIKQEIFFVIDDFQFLNIPDEYKILNDLLSKLPSNIHFVFSSRVTPNINLVPLKLNDDLLMIDSHDLVLNQKEISQLSQVICQYSLTGYDIDLIANRTEGWLAGIKIILLALNEHGLNFIKNLERKSLDVMDGFFLDIYESLSEKGRQFFLISAIFERFNEDLCDQVLGRSDSSKFIHYLMSLSAFIIKDVNRPGWYRYHALLKSFLIKQLEQVSDDARLSELHRKSAIACIEMQDYELATYHCFLTQDNGFIEEVLCTCTDNWLKLGDFSLVIYWLDKFNEEQLLNNDSLTLNYAYSLIFSRRFNQAHYFLSLIDNLVFIKKKASFQQDVEFLHLSLRLFQRDIEVLDRSMVERLMQAVYSSEHRIFSLVIAAYFEMQSGQLDEALRLAHHARSILRLKGHVFLQCYADLIIALCDRYTGRGIQAIQYISKLYDSTKMTQGSMPWLCMNVAMMVVKYEQNDIEAASVLCKAVLPYVNHACVTEVIATVYLCYSRLQFDLGQVCLARSTLEQLNRILILGKYPRFVSQSGCELIRQAYVSGDHIMMEKYLNEYAIDLSSSEKAHAVNGLAFDETQERRILCACYGHGLNAQFSQAKLKLAALIDELKPLRLISRLMIATCNYIVMEYKQGQIKQAMSLLHVTVKEYGLSVFSRNVFDEAPGIAQVFVAYVDAYQVDLPAPFLQVYRNIFTHMKQPKIALDVSSLTDKESQIYQLLKAGLSNQQISAETGAALSTTKWHLKNIYQKLGVNNRAEAIIMKTTFGSMAY